MSTALGVMVVEILESAGQHHLGDAMPGAYAAFLHQIGGADTFRAYDDNATYWERVQALLDSFFSSAERAEVCARLIGQPELRARPEFQGFLAHALAERRMQELIAGAMFAISAKRPAAAPLRRPR